MFNYTGYYLTIEPFYGCGENFNIQQSTQTFMVNQVCWLYIETS